METENKSKAILISDKTNEALFCEHLCSHHAFMHHLLRMTTDNSIKRKKVKVRHSKSTR